MLDVIGAKSLDDLLEQSVPASIRSDWELDLPPARSEQDVLAALRRFAAATARRSLIGMGYTGTFTPPVIQRNVLENPAWYTAYTPYQAEISQGRLEALLDFQTTVAELTGLPVANASLLDEATAAAEAMAMARRLSRRRRNASSCTRHAPANDRRTADPRRADRHRARRRRRRRARRPGRRWVLRGLVSLPTSTGAVVDWRAASTVFTSPAASPWWRRTSWRAC